jgi:hypothetical protein
MTFAPVNLDAPRAKSVLNSCSALTKNGAARPAGHIRTAAAGGMHRFTVPFGVEKAGALRKYV